MQNQIIIDIIFVLTFMTSSLALGYVLGVMTKRPAKHATKRPAKRKQ
jgi:hypothetical protein